MNEILFEEKLDKIKTVMTASLPPCLINPEIQVSSMYRWAKGEVGLRLTGYIWGEYQAAIQVTCPTNRWQPFKERHFPRWLKRLWPVHYYEMTVNPKVVYPELKEPPLPLGKLEKMKVVMVSIISYDLVNDMDMEAIEIWAADDADDLTIKENLKRFVWGEYQDKIVIQYPDGWRQALKACWLPQWLEDYVPVQYRKKIIITAAEVCPQLKISLPEERHRVILHPQVREEQEDHGVFRWT